jgi:hypothetical protein
MSIDEHNYIGAELRRHNPGGELIRRNWPWIVYRVTADMRQPFADSVPRGIACGKQWAKTRHERVSGHIVALIARDARPVCCL